jgi:two-component system OmpR family response regulator
VEAIVRVLIVEDELRLAKVIRQGLRAQGLQADVSLRGEDAVWMANTTAYDAIVLDLRLPGIDGLETLRRLREQGTHSPILVLTAHDGVEERVAALDGGADDYVAKPFVFAELTARLRALGRRGGVAHPPVLEADGLRLDPATRRVWRGDTEIFLVPKEFGLLEALMREPGRVLSREHLLERAWEDPYAAQSNLVDSWVRFLRRKIDRPFGTETIETVRGVGYRLRAER